VIDRTVSTEYGHAKVPEDGCLDSGSGSDDIDDENNLFYFSSFSLFLSLVSPSFRLVSNRFLHQQQQFLKNLNDRFRHCFPTLLDLKKAITQQQQQTTTVYFICRCKNITVLLVKLLITPIMPLLLLPSFFFLLLPRVEGFLSSSCVLNAPIFIHDNNRRATTATQQERYNRGILFLQCQDVVVFGDIRQSMSSTAAAAAAANTGMKRSFQQLTAAAASCQPGQRQSSWRRRRQRRDVSLAAMAASSDSATTTTTTTADMVVLPTTLRRRRRASRVVVTTTTTTTTRNNNNNNNNKVNSNSSNNNRRRKNVKSSQPNRSKNDNIMDSKMKKQKCPWRKWDVMIQQLQVYCEKHGHSFITKKQQQPYTKISLYAGGGDDDDAAVNGNDHDNDDDEWDEELYHWTMTLRRNYKHQAVGVRSRKNGISSCTAEEASVKPTTVYIAQHDDDDDDAD